MEGEGWLSIAHQYKIKFADLRAANADKDDSLWVNEIIAVPVAGKPSAAGKEEKPAVKAAKEKEPVVDVKKGSKVKAKTDSTTAMGKTKAVTKTDSSAPIKDVSVKNAKEFNESGIASWTPDNNLEQNKYHALHRTAPVGTIIHLTSKQNSKGVYCKVVGTIDSATDSSDVIIKITKLCADKIEMKNWKFDCDLKYVVVE